MRRISLLFAVLSAIAVPVLAHDGIRVSGSIQSDMMIAPQTDKAIGAYADAYDNDAFLTNTYVDLSGQGNHVDFGGRFEFTQFPMPGFDNAYNHFKGWGLPNLWVKGKCKAGTLTLGSLYEQFGSGFILRTYEQRSLGVDNSLMGIRATTDLLKGVRLKALSGLQRRYWSWDPKSVISGVDANFAIEEWLSAMNEQDQHLSFGFSWVNKYEEEDTDIMVNGNSQYPNHRLKVPEFVNAFDARLSYQHNSFSALAEYAIKSQDPNSLNNYVYGTGSAAMLSLTYTDHGLSLLAQAKRSENMAFRSRRTASALCTAGYINHLPAFTLDHTYSLAALYPYATQMEGEWAYQGSVAYNFRRKTALGGKFGTKIKANYSLVRGLQNNAQVGMQGSDGIDNDFFKMGDVYYQDFNLQLDKRVTKNFELHLMYMYQQYNKEVIQKEGGNIYSNIFVAEGKYKFNRQYTLRAEGQYLGTEHASGDWYFGLLELSVVPHFMVTISDQIGHTEPKAGVYGDLTHYYNFALTCNYEAHRLMLSYGRTRAGYNCTGGVCRFVPASKGLTINYNYNF